MATRAQQIPELTGPFFDDGGVQILTPYAKFYIGGGAGSANTKSAYADINKSVSFTKKSLSDEGNDIYGDGIYDIEVYEGDPDDGGVLQYTLSNRKYVATIGNTRTITADTTGTIDDALVLVDTSLDDVTYTLADAEETTGRVIIIKKTSSDANTLTVAAPSGQTIDGSASASGTNQNYALIVVSNGTNYFGTIGDADTLGGTASSGYLKTDGTNPLENNTTLKGRNAADSADINILKINASDELEIIAPLANDTYIVGRNAADSGNVNIIKVDTNDNVLIPASPQVARAWVSFNGTGTPAIRGSYNVSSITDNGTGDYTVNFTTALGNANSAFSIYAVSTAATSLLMSRIIPAAPLTTAIRFTIYSATPAAADVEYVNLIVFGGN